MGDKVENLHIVEPFTLHSVETVEGRDRPLIKQVAYDRGEIISDAADIESIRKARDEGTISHNHFVTVKVDAPEPEQEVHSEPAKEEIASADLHPVEHEDHPADVSVVEEGA